MGWHSRFLGAANSIRTLVYRNDSNDAESAETRTR